MPLLKCKSKLYYFAHIPKTGGSSVEFAMQQAGAKRALHYHKKLDYVRCNLQHMHAELFDVLVPPKFYRKGFCVTRHPIARLTSEYYWRDTLGHVKASFDDWVCNKINDYAEDNYILDNHFRPQHEFVGKKIQVFRFEDGMDAILKTISEITGLSLDPSTHQRQSTNKVQLTWSPETREKAVSFYAKDFETFDYAVDIDLPHLTLSRQP